MASPLRHDRTSTAPESLPMIAFSSSISATARAERRHDLVTRLTNLATVAALFFAIADVGFCHAPNPGPCPGQHELHERGPSTDRDADDLRQINA